MGLTRAQLEQQIASAFPELPVPAADRIAVDDEDLEARQLRAAFGGRTWSALTHEEVFQHPAAFLSAEGYSYYLPAYLFAALANYKHLLTHTVYGLGPPRDPALDAWRKRRFARLTPPQRAAVRAFLEYLRDEPELGRYFDEGEIDEALAYAWGEAP